MITHLIILVKSSSNFRLRCKYTPSKTSHHYNGPYNNVKKITARQPDESTMEPLHITTLQLSGLSKQSRKIHIFPKMKTAPLISLVVLYVDGCTTALDKKEM